MSTSLSKKIETKQAIIGVIGLGYVGLPTSVHYASKGYKTLGFDLDIRKISSVQKGISYIGDVQTEILAGLVNDKKFSATNEMERLNEVDVVVVCVPTPIDEYKQPNLRFVDSAAKTIADHITEETLIIFESTTYPGTTEEIFIPYLEEKGFEVGKNTYLAYSPERVDPGNETYNLTNTPKIVGGFTKKCTELAAMVIGETAQKVSSIKVAELSKVYENTFRWINIAYANEMSIIARKMGIDLNEVIDASKTKPYGFMAFYPGPGVGGHCIPVDPYYMTYKAKEYGEMTRMIELSGEINDKMPEIVVNRIQDVLNEKEKSLKGSNVVLLGVAYKSDISDVRESPILPLVELLKKKGTDLTIVDDFVGNFVHRGEIYENTKLTKELLNNADVVVIGTNHSTFDYKWIGEHTDTIFDTRHVVKDVNCNVVYL